MAIDAVLNVDGSPVANLVSVSRSGSLAEPCFEFDAVVAGDPTGPFTIGDTVTLTEQGTLVLTGILDEINDDLPGQLVNLRGRDNFARARDTYVEEAFETANETVEYWAARMCAYAALPYAFQSGLTSGSEIFSDKVPLGRKLVSEALTEICARAGWIMRMQASGTVEFLIITQPATPDYDLSRYSASVSQNDAATRNVVRIWGWSPTLNQRIIVSSSRVVAGLNIDRTAVVANPHISTEAQASALAEFGLDQWANYASVGSMEFDGNPAIRLGQSARVRAQTMEVTDSITDLSAESGPGGYNMTITVGRRSARFPRFPVPTSGSAPPSPIIWQAGDVPGEAYDSITVGLYTYIVGQRINAPVSNNQWRVECRVAATGVLAYGVDWSPTGFTGSLQYANRVVSDGTYLYIMGDTAGLFGYSTRISKVRMSDGVQVAISATVGTAAPDLVSSGLYVYAPSRNFAGQIDRWLASTMALPVTTYTPVPLGSLRVNGFTTSVAYVPETASGFRITTVDLTTGATANTTASFIRIDNVTPMFPYGGNVHFFTTDGLTVTGGSLCLWTPYNAAPTWISSDIPSRVYSTSPRRAGRFVVFADYAYVVSFNGGLGQQQTAIVDTVDGTTTFESLTGYAGRLNGLSPGANPTDLVGSGEDSGIWSVVVYTAP
jgi:hypothetical protein